MKKKLSTPLPPFAVGEVIELKIDRLAYDGGRGVGRYSGFVVFVADTAPDEVILSKITEVKKNYAVAELVEIKLPSPFRRQPPCPVAGRCGGCSWQHVNYEEQLKQKQKILEFHLRNFLPPEIKSIQIIPAPNEFRYRNRIQLHSQNGHIGFFAKGTNDIVDIDDCLISDERLLTDKKELARLKRTSGKFEIAVGNNGAKTVRNLKVEESEFTQVNSAQNAFMQQYIVDKISHLLSSKDQQLTPVQKIYDLYCGSGNLTFPLAASLPSLNLVGIEFSKSAIDRAKSNAATKIEFIAQDVFKFLQAMLKAENSAFVLDPPRAGLGPDVSREILRLKPAFLLYISCNLATLGRDLHELTKQFRIASVIGVDMFPQTEYVETILIMVPRDKI